MKKACTLSFAVRARLLPVVLDIRGLQIITSSQILIIVYRLILILSEPVSHGVCSMKCADFEKILHVHAHVTDFAQHSSREEFDGTVASQLIGLSIYLGK